MILPVNISTNTFCAIYHIKNGTERTQAQQNLSQAIENELKDHLHTNERGETFEEQLEYLGYDALIVSDDKGVKLGFSKDVEVQSDGSLIYTNFRKLVEYRERQNTDFFDIYAARLPDVKQRVQIKKFEDGYYFYRNSKTEMEIKEFINKEKSSLKGCFINTLKSIGILAAAILIGLGIDKSVPSKSIKTTVRKHENTELLIKKPVSNILKIIKKGIK